jgi:arginase
VTRPLLLAALIATFVTSVGFAQDATNRQSVHVALINMPYVGERNVPEISGGPDYLAQGGLQSQLQQLRVEVKESQPIKLSTEDDKAYGSWNRLALANGQLAKVLADERRAGNLPVGLLANCSSILGMLSGLQHSGPSGKPLRVGLVFIDAHGDYNTPETTLSGMLGGMPVAIANGLCLTRMRLKTGLEPAIPGRHIVEICVRDTDPLEQELLDRSEIQQLSLEDIRARSANFHREMKRLSESTDAIYVHVDMDALDPREVAGHPLTVPGGPTSVELAAALEEMFKYEKAAAFGVASTPYGEHDKDGVSRRAAYNLILGAVKGVQQRNAK